MGFGFFFFFPFFEVVPVPLSTALGSSQTVAMKEYLAYFASKNYEFRIPELVAIAKCFGFEIRCDEPFVDGAFHVRVPFLLDWIL